MTQYRFQVLEMRDSPPEEWLGRWAKRYEDTTGYDPDYNELIKKYESFTADDFRRIGRWKDGVTAEGRWKPNVASVAYLIWERAAIELPRCPTESGVEAFLKDWANREYEDLTKNGARKKHFGVSRASTLLHFVSGGRYPIFDSRVREAISRLHGRPQLWDTASVYMTKFLPIFNELADCCGCKTTDDFRMLDKALFAYGATDKRMFSK
jgi:hypothetical protein